MYCPTCQSALAEIAEACPTCGDDLRPIEATDTVLSVEGAARADAIPDSPDAPSLVGEAETDRASLLPVVSRRGDTRAIARLPQLSVLAWRQPGVRAAVKTGAGAIALSLAMRAAGRMLTDRRSRSLASRAVTSLLGEQLRPARPSGAPSHSETFEIMETYISVRRVRRIVRR